MLILCVAQAKTEVSFVRVKGVEGTIRKVTTMSLVLVALVAGVVLLGFLIASLQKWKRDAIERALDITYNEHMENAVAEDRANESQRQQDGQNLLILWDRLWDLQCAIHGMTRFDYIADEPKRVPQECYRPFVNELDHIARGLDYIGKRFDENALVGKDLAFYQAWVSELVARFWEFDLQHSRNQARNSKSLENIRKCYEAVGKKYYMASTNRQFGYFGGMLHCVEVLLQEDSNENEVKAWISELSKQLSKLTVSLEYQSYGLFSEEEPFLRLLLDIQAPRSNV